MYSLAKRENADWSVGVARQGWSWASAENALHRRPAWARQAARLLMEAYPSQPDGYDLLAAASAAEGRFDQAVKFAEQALSLARQGGDLSARIRERRDRFKRNEVWIGPP